MITYFDTSVLVAYYTVEDRSEEANSIVAAAELPVISDLGIAELNITIARKQREGYLTAAAASAVYALFDQHLRDVFVRVAIDGKHAEATRGLPDRLGVPLRTLDALHLVITLDVEGALATFDERLRQAASASGLNVLPSPSRRRVTQPAQPEAPARSPLPPFDNGGTEGGFPDG